MEIVIENPLIIDEKEVKISENGYIFVTIIGKTYKRLAGDWKRKKSTESLIESISDLFDEHIDLIKAYSSGKGNGTWMHPILFLEYIKYSIPNKPELYKYISKWLNEVYGLNLVNKFIIKKEEIILVKENEIVEDIQTIENIIDNVNKNDISIIDRFLTFTDKSIKIYEVDKETYFCAKDVAILLGYKDVKKAISANVNVKYRTILYDLYGDLRGGKKSPTLNNEQKAIYLSESGLYEFVLSCKKPSVEPFKDWVIGEVLPSIRKSGEYKLQLQLEEANKLIKEKSDENKWLHVTNKHNVLFNLRSEKVESLYVGAHQTESNNFIYKIGKSASNIKRGKVHSTSTAPENPFNMFKKYETYDDISINVEKFIHALLKPLNTNMGNSRTEHFLAHLSFIDKFITKILKNVDEYVYDINNYILLLKDNQFDYPEINKILLANVSQTNITPETVINVEDTINVKTNKVIDDIILNLKSCKNCKISKELDKFELIEGDLYYDKCIECNIKVIRCCKKCGEDKYDIKDYTLTPPGVRKEYCNSCYTAIKHASLYKHCKKCNKQVLKTLFSVNDNLRNRICDPCRAFLDRGNSIKCKICKEQLPKSNYSLKNDGTLDHKCNACKLIPKVEDSKKCQKCKQQLSKTLFVIKPDGSIDRTCIPCRSIPTSYNSKTCIGCNNRILKVNFKLNNDGTIGNKCIECCSSDIDNEL